MRQTSVSWKPPVSNVSDGCNLCHETWFQVKEGVFGFYPLCNELQEKVQVDYYCKVSRILEY